MAPDEKMSELSQATLYKRLVEANSIMEDLIKAEPHDIHAIRERAGRFLSDSAERRIEATAKARAAAIEAKRKKFKQDYILVRIRILDLINEGVTNWRKINERLLAAGMKPPKASKWRYGLLVAIAPEIRKKP